MKISQLPFKQLSRLMTISKVMVRYRLDDFLSATHLFRPMRIIRIIAPWGRKHIAHLPLATRTRMALEVLGPVFVKFGQILSTRKDLLSADWASELAKLQDKVPPFSGELAKQIIESSLNAKIDDIFDHFDIEPLASASVAQVHAAQLKNGRSVVVKVLRPGIANIITRDVGLLRIIAHLAERYSSELARLRPLDVVAEFERYIFDELDLQREAANASQLRRNFEKSADLYVPEVFWDWITEGVMVMERVEGIPISDIDALKAVNTDLAELAQKGVLIFYTQVFKDNFFHADMHPGNILVDVTDPKNPSYIAMDFGIVGSLTPQDQHYMAENFRAFFDRNYTRIAELHIESGWVPAETRIYELESAFRTVCEPNFARPLNEISFGEVLLKLFKVARRFNVSIQPQLVLLQKTLLNIEGLGRQLYPQLDLWATAQPILEKIVRDKHGLDAASREFKSHLPMWLEHAPEVPGLIYDYLQKATRGDLRLKVETEKPKVRLVNLSSLWYLCLAATMAVCASILFSVEGNWRWLNFPVVPVGMSIASILCFFIAHFKTK